MPDSRDSMAYPRAKNTYMYDRASLFLAPQSSLPSTATASSPSSKIPAPLL